MIENLIAGMERFERLKVGELLVGPEPAFVVPDFVEPGLQSILKSKEYQSILADKLQSKDLDVERDPDGKIVGVKLRSDHGEEPRKPSPITNGAVVLLGACFLAVLGMSIVSRSAASTLFLVCLVAYPITVKIMSMRFNKHMKAYGKLLLANRFEQDRLVALVREVELESIQDVRQLARNEYKLTCETARAECHRKNAEWNLDIVAFERKSGGDYLIPKLERAFASMLIQGFSPPACRYHQNERLLTMDCNLLSLDEFKVNGASIGLRSSVKKISIRQWNEAYDSYLYQLCLLAIWIGCKCDTKELVDAAVFNGWVTYVDPTTGNQKTVCLMSAQVKKAEYMSLNLSRVEAKACFRSLKGITGAKLLSERIPVKPVLQLNRNDSRFVASYDVADGLDESFNVATMDWIDFENLTRELFAKEFATNCEVKLTQSSRDGGVDAVIFDLDPIRGGKIVVQAKRYTNVVGLSAVRDLYGTVVNEGAMKGILVTTAYFGADAYEFVKDKPLTLINGDELLYLLEKYGYKAKIDLKAAKDSALKNG